VECAPRAFGFVRPNSRRYQEWQNLAYEATVDEKEDTSAELPEGTLVDHTCVTLPYPWTSTSSTIFVRDAVIDKGVHVKY
jgi:hypothetical protein